MQPSNNQASENLTQTLRIYSTDADRKAHATILRNANKPTNDHAIALIGSGENIKEYLNQHPNIKNIIFHLNNSPQNTTLAQTVGRALLQRGYNVFAKPPIFTKTWTEQLERQSRPPVQIPTKPKIRPIDHQR